MPDLAARMALVIGGLGALFGSFQTWVVFSVLFSFIPVSGAVLGFGLITALFAIPVVGSGLVPSGSPMSRRAIAVGSLCASGIVVGVAVAAIGIQVGVAIPVFYVTLPEVRRYGIGWLQRPFVAAWRWPEFANARSQLEMSHSRAAGTSPTPSSCRPRLPA